MALLISGQAFAECAPEPTTANGITTCDGLDANGLLVTTYGTQVTVLPSATVRPGSGAAITVQVPASNYYGAPVGLTVGGLVDGGAGNGVAVFWQPPASGGFGGDLTLNMIVANGGTVTGNNGIVAGRTGSGYGNTYVSIDNAGAISGTSGVALVSTAPGYAGFSSIINRAGGVIGAISAQVGRLDNAGTIDGGTRSAIDWGNVYLSFMSQETRNSGTIISTNGSATLANLPSGRILTNSGSIVNNGSGAAIAGDLLTINNLAGGRIVATASAIRANTFLQLTNAGTIDGNVLAAASPTSIAGSTVDSTAGQIRGSLIFGAGNDTLVATYNGAGLTTGVSGTIDGGAGTDTVRIRFASDATVATTPILPTNFERFLLAPDFGMTTTLADGFTAADTILIGGTGTIINRTTLSGGSRVIADDLFGVAGSPRLVNAGRIITTTATPNLAAVTLNTATRFENSGTISAAGSGVLFSSEGSFVNTGTISAANTGVSLFGPSFSNSGVIVSTGGIGVILNGSSGSNWTNSGRIEGNIAGANISSNFVNTGTIASAGTGVAINPYATLENRAGGVISGGTKAIGPLSSSDFLFNATVANAGTINGDVVMVGLFSNSNNRFFALPGGILNGNLTLGKDGTLITELVNNGTGAFAGITGTVSGAGASLRYRVRADGATVLGVPTQFANVGYDLFDNAKLTLTAPASQTKTLTLAGTGSVDITADFATTTQPAISIVGLSQAPGEIVPNTALTIVSRGSISLDHPDATTTAYAAGPGTGRIHQRGGHQHI